MSVVEHWVAPIEVAERGVGDAEQVRNAGCVEDPAMGAFRGAQVGVAVEIQDTCIRVNPLHSRYHADGDGAVAAEHERNGTVTACLLDCVCDPSRDPHHRGHVPLRRVLVIDREHLSTDVPAILHTQAGSDQSVDKAPTAQHPWRQILTGVVSTCTRRHTQKHNPGPIVGSCVHGRQCASRR